MLDLLKLHKEEDNRDIRCWILAGGNNLIKMINDIKNQVLLMIEEEELVNELFSRLGVNLSLSRYENPRESLCSWARKKRLEAGLTKKSIAKLTGTSGIDWNNIENGKHLPSCQKIRKIVKFLGKPPFEFRCKGDDFCLRSANCVYESINSDKKFFPIIVISEILNIWKHVLDKTEREFDYEKNKIIRNIEYLTLNQHCSIPIKAVKDIDEELAKIIGAFAADGNYYPPDMIRWEEEYKDNMDALAKWLHGPFGISVSVEKSKRQRNSYVFRFRNKTISRYLETFFGFYPRKKSYTVDEPELIKNSSLNIRKNFAKGALMFDSGVNTDMSITFSVMSKKFRDSITDIIQNDANVAKSKSANKEGMWTLIISIARNRDNNKLLDYFERGTVKWKRLNGFLNGFEQSVENIEDAKLLLDNSYPKLRNNNFSEILDAVVNRKEFSLYDLLGELEISRPCLQKRMNILIRANILKTERGRRVIYNFNENVDKWRLPETSPN